MPFPCSRNARPQKGLVRRAQLGTAPAPFLRWKITSELGGTIYRGTRPTRAVEGQPAIPRRRDEQCNARPRKGSFDGIIRRSFEGRT